MKAKRNGSESETVAAGGAEPLVLAAAPGRSVRNRFQLEETVRNRRW